MLGTNSLIPKAQDQSSYDDSKYIKVKDGTFIFEIDQKFNEVQLIELQFVFYKAEITNLSISGYFEYKPHPS